jgi:hypothetical protein
MFSKDADCPFWRGRCKEHKCRLYIQVTGKHPQTGADLSDWGCSLAFLPMLVIKGAQETHQAAAAIESFRNEMVNAQDTARQTEVALAKALNQVAVAGRNTKLINGK